MLLKAGLFDSTTLETMTLVETELEDNFIKQKFCPAIAKGLFKNIIDIDLSHNLFVHSYPLLASTLQAHCPLLHSLSLVSCKFHESTPLTLMKTPPTANPQLAALRYLRRLDLSSSLKGCEQATQLAASSALKHLEYLKLKNCSIANEGLASIFSSRYLRRLKVLIVCKNLITKLVLPNAYEKHAGGKVKVQRDLMELSLLDVRSNKISMIKGTSSMFLKYTVVLAWDNAMGGKQIEKHLGKTKILEEFKEANPLFIVKPRQEQLATVENV